MNKVERNKLKCYNWLIQHICREEGETICPLSITDLGYGNAVAISYWPDGMFENKGGAVRMKPDDYHINDPITVFSNDMLEDYRSFEDKVLDCMEKLFPGEVV